MTSESQTMHGFLGALLAPLRAPQGVVANIETIASALVSLQRDVHERLASLDERVGALAHSVGALRAPLDRVDDKVTELQKLERAITGRMDSIQDDLNARVQAVSQEVHTMRAPIERMSRDLGTAIELLPNPNDGPMARLKDTFTAS